MKLRTVGPGTTGPDVQGIQQALNRSDLDLSLDEDGKFGSKTEAAVRKFQQAYGLKIDGRVGPQTRSALFPLVATTVTLVATRTDPDSPAFKRAVQAISPGVLHLGEPAQAPLLRPAPLLTPSPLLTPRALGGGPVDWVRIPGLTEAVLAPRSAPTCGGGKSFEFQQLAQTQRQFTGLFRDPVDTFAIGWQTVFPHGDDDGHVELATGWLLQSPIGIKAGGNDWTLAAFAQATWIDPLGHLGWFHYWQPYAQLQAQANLTGPALPTLQTTLTPVNMVVDLDPDSGLQLSVNGSSVWSFLFTRNGVVSSWGPQISVGITGRLRLFGN